MKHVLMVDPADHSSEGRELLQVRGVKAGEVVEIALDVSKWLGASDAIAKVQAVVSPNDRVGDLTITHSGFDTGVVFLRLDGGRAGMSYSVSISLQSAGNRNLLRAPEVHFDAEDEADAGLARGTVSPSDTVSVVATDTDGAVTDHSAPEAPESPDAT